MAVLQLRDAIPGKAKKMASARNRGPEGDGRKVKTSSAVPGQEHGHYLLPSPASVACLSQRTVLSVRIFRISSSFAGSTSLPDDAAPLVAGGLAALLIVVALLATGNIGAGSIQLPSTADLPSPPIGSILL